MNPDRIDSLLANNRDFVARHLQADPDYFARLAEGQHPEFLWIGCSDSRVSPNLITGTEPGEMFVHRNIANLVVQTDMNLLSVLQYAVDVLQVRHVIVCGHQGCGGVKAALTGARHGLIDNWLRAVQDTRDFHWAQLAPLAEAQRLARLVELNVIEQVNNLAKTHIVQDAWARGQALQLHGWVFDLATGWLTRSTGAIGDGRSAREVCKFHGAGAIA